MLKLRIIPVLTFNGFALVKTKQFGAPRMVGNPIQAAKVYNARGVDELVLLDIMATKQSRSLPIEIVKEVLKECYMPVAVGGGIRSIEQISELLTIGADKVIIKTAAINDPAFIERAVQIFGAQCICIAVDAKRHGDQFIVHRHGEGELILVSEFVEQMNRIGVGELMVTSTDQDGMMNGFNAELAQFIRPRTNVPIIMVGGAGEPVHFLELFKAAQVEAAAAASIFHFTQYTPLDIKNLLNDHAFPVRFQSKWISQTS